MTTLQIIAALIALVLYFAIVAVLVSVSRAVIHSVPRKPALLSVEAPQKLLEDQAKRDG